MRTNLDYKIYPSTLKHLTKVSRNISIKSNLNTLKSIYSVLHKYYMCYSINHKRLHIIHTNFIATINIEDMTLKVSSHDLKNCYSNINQIMGLLRNTTCSFPSNSVSLQNPN